MMEWTDRHCRMLHRLLSRQARLYTEMVTADAVIHGDRARLLGFDPAEHPVALQLGGSSPQKLAQAARIGEDFGYAEINLNVGCPSDRVQSGRFGACLMQEPDLVAACMAAMAEVVQIPVTVKCRLGVDDQDPQIALRAMIDACRAAGVETFIIHARKAWLSGLSPKENRDIPPLDYGLVHQIKAEYPALKIIINGGLSTLDAAAAQLPHLDGVMMGRAAYQHPALLAAVDGRFFAAEDPGMTNALAAWCDYVERHCAAGVPLHAMTRHMLGLFNGRAGARMFRRHMSEQAPRSGAGVDVLKAALAHVDLTHIDLTQDQSGSAFAATALGAAPQ